MNPPTTGEIEMQHAPKIQAMGGSAWNADIQERAKDLDERIAEAVAGRWPERPACAPYRGMGFLERMRILSEIEDAGLGPDEGSFFL